MHSQCEQAECNSRPHGGLAPRHLPSFIIHTAIYHTHAPAVHTNERLQPTDMDRVRPHVWVFTFSTLERKVQKISECACRRVEGRVIASVTLRMSSIRQCQCRLVCVCWEERWHFL